MATTVNNNNIESKKAKAERQERYNARCKELEAEALAQMPYKVGDTVKSRYGETGRVVEMYPEVTGDTDSPHLIYEYDGKPTVNVVILDADGKRHCAHWSFFTLQEPVECETYFADTLADDLKAGDRVLSRHYGAQATVLGKEWDKQRKAWYYRVQFDKMQRHMDGSEFNVTEFHRDGLTKNYDPVTCSERVGNAEYYRETLLAEFWGNNRTPRTVYGMEIFKPTDRRPSWLVVAAIFSEPKEMTLREVCDMLAVRYQEEQGKAA